MRFETMDGTPGLQLDDVAHILLPGRGRNPYGDDISQGAYDRVDTAVDLYTHYDLAERAGLIVCSGYKTPADIHGDPWMSNDAPGERFVGIPEADATRRALELRNIPTSAIRVERHSIDTVTNFARSEREGHFGDDRPVAVVAQEAHLERMLKYIAPKTLRRDYIGVVVPEAEPKDQDSLSARLVSRFILAGLHAESKDLVDRTDRRARAVWSGVLLVQKYTNRNGAAYYTEAK